jgi:iron(III) transport system permease protein
LRRIEFVGLPPAVVTATVNTLGIAALAASITVAIGFCVATALRLAQRPSVSGRGVTRFVAAAASLGYAVPGTILAVGLLAPLAVLDNALGALLRGTLGVSPGLILLGSGAAVVYACCVRFQAIATGSIDAGLSRIPLSIDDAARMCGAGSLAVARRIHVPLLRPAIGAAALLIFVDCMKELPATLLLRPLNFETLATLLYAEASRGTYEDGAIAALLIVIFGLAPVVVLAKLSRAPQAARSETGIDARLGAVPAP